jgi:DNA-3-methyladenine glycosylase I
LRKRENFRCAFAGFEPEAVAGRGDVKVARLLADQGIVRHRAKIEATLGDARAGCRIEAREGVSDVVWRHVGGAPMQNAWAHDGQVPAMTPATRALSRERRAEGFRFGGPAVVHTFTQAAGMVTHQVVGCPRHADLRAPG